MNAKKAIVLSVAGLMVFYVLVSPVDAASTTRQLLAMLADGANGLFEFIEELFARA